MARITTNVRHKTDPREPPSYSLAEAAHYLCIPISTLRSWVVGRHYYLTKDKRKFFEPLIYPSQSSPYTLLSFVNLVEAHILNAIRRQHKISLNKVGKALDYLKEQFPSRHPLADHAFVTNGLDLFIGKYGQLVTFPKKASSQCLIY